MFKNVASQKIIVFAFDATTNLPKTGDAANITAYISKDFGTVTVLTDTSATEMDATNAKGYYLFDISQTETNADNILVSAKSATANVVVVGAPAAIFTNPPNFTAASIDSNGRVDVIKLAGTTQTARDIGASVLLSSGTGTGQISLISGIAKVDVDTIKTNPVVNAGTVTFPTGATLASTTNITGGTITTVTNLTNAPTSGDLTATMKTSVTTAATAATPTAAAVTGNVGGNVTGSVGSVVGAVGSVTGNVGGNVIGSVGSVVGLTPGNLDVAVSTRSSQTSVDALPDDIWNEPLSSHQTVGTAGRSLRIAGDILSETTATGTPTTTTIQLSSGSAVDDFYRDLEIVPLSGALGGQAKTITSYVGATKTVIIDEPWTSAPSNGDALIIRATHKHSINQIQAAILSDATPFAGASINDILTDTAEIGVAGAGLTNINLPNQTMDIVGNITGNISGSVGSVTGLNPALLDVAVSTRLATSGYTAPLDAAGTRSAVGLATANLDIQLADIPTVSEFNARTVTSATYATSASLATMQTTIDKLDDTLEDDAGTYRFTANALEQAPSGSGSLTAADVWAYSTRVLTAGTNIALAKGTGVTGFNDLSAAQVNAEVDTAISDVGLTPTVTGRIDAAISTRLASASYTAPDNATITAINLKTTNLPASPAATGDIPTTAQIATAVYTTQMTESYAADGVAPTLAQALFLTMQSLSEFSIAGTTITVKKLDGAATAAQFTLDDGTTPTSRTRSS